MDLDSTDYAILRALFKDAKKDYVCTQFSTLVKELETEFIDQIELKHRLDNLERAEFTTSFDFNDYGLTPAGLAVLGQENQSQAESSRDAFPEETLRLVTNVLEYLRTELTDSSERDQEILATIRDLSKKIEANETTGLDRAGDVLRQIISGAAGNELHQQLSRAAARLLELILRLHS